jgi:MoaA/NifB/PqqE/SkfB family radical SAM enzyme
MDPYIDSEKLDPGHPMFERKIENLRRGDRAHRELLEEVDALPVKLTLETTDTCNLDCPHCQIPRADKTPRMDAAILDRVVSELFPTLIELHPTNLGEPLTWPLFRRLTLEMERHGVLLDLTTNGTLLDEARIEWIAPIARDLKVSFDGATPETFERLRRGARFSAVCANVRALAARLEREPRRPVIALQMTLMRSNYRELPALVRLAAELGATKVKGYHLFSFRPEMDAESLMPMLEAWRPVLEEALLEGDRLGILLECAEPAAEEGNFEAGGLVPAVCHLPWHEVWVDVDGAVLPCHSHGGDTAGNVLDARFTALWNGPLYRRIRRAYARGRPDWNCTDCGMNCQRSSDRGAVPYDKHNFLSEASRSGFAPADRSVIRWSGRMKQFDLVGRRRGR